jgi:hypothetical protein
VLVGRASVTGSGGGEVGVDVVVVQGSVGVQRDLGAEQAGGGVLELEYVESVAVVGDVPAEPAEAKARSVMPCPAARLRSWRACAGTCCSVAGGRCGDSARG